MNIPTNQLSKVAQNILTYVPLPNTPSDGTSTDANNLTPSSSRQNKMADISRRGDQIWNNNQKSMVSVGLYHEDEFSVGAEYPDLRAAAQYAERWHQHGRQQFHSFLQPPEQDGGHQRTRRSKLEQQPQEHGLGGLVSRRRVERRRFP